MRLYKSGCINNVVNFFYIFFSVVDYNLVDEATQDSDYTSDCESDVEDEDIIFNHIAGY